MKKLLCFAAAMLASVPLFALDKITFATEPTYPPFEYLDEAGNYQGFDMDLARAVCAAAEVKCEFKSNDFDSLIPGLRYHKFDAVIAAMDVTEERSKAVDFSNVYVANSAVYVARSGDLKSIHDLHGKRVAVQNGTTHLNYLDDRMKAEKITIVPYKGYPQAYLDLGNKRVDAVFSDAVVAHEWLEKRGKGSFEVVGEPVTDSKYFGSGLAIAVRKGNAELLEVINKALAKIKADGTYQKIYDKHLAN
ncbi:arginine transport system substrate-binding protein [Sinobacterium caligoides]|uniref:Arginine transport system substrate-binding protein n=1 Tax=Sinobacterium caligoides TaxID=933926 RepID=A0A3N2DFY8_9GAMM|nr:transporter substrate-binding domain-containing protein [Sinobacterium caligoides]ROR98707.1 arginine transport system substrate-binding protein [Sinobacterium caligoides]